MINITIKLASNMRRDFPLSAISLCVVKSILNNQKNEELIMLLLYSLLFVLYFLQKTKHTRILLIHLFSK